MDPVEGDPCPCSSNEYSLVVVLNDDDDDDDDNVQVTESKAQDLVEKDEVELVAAEGREGPSPPPPSRKRARINPPHPASIVPCLPPPPSTAPPPEIETPPVGTRPTTNRCEIIASTPIASTLLHHQAPPTLNPPTATAPTTTTAPAIAAPVDMAFTTPRTQSRPAELSHPLASPPTCSPPRPRDDLSLDANELVRELRQMLERSWDKVCALRQRVAWLEGREAKVRGASISELNELKSHLFDVDARINTELNQRRADTLLSGRRK